MIGDIEARKADAVRLLECEARYLLDRMSKPERQAYLAHRNVEGRRAKLEAQILKEYNLRRSTK